MSDVELYERLARIETIILSIQESICDQKKCDETHNTKLDQLLNNDQHKLERIAKVEEKVKNLKAALWLFLVPLAANIARWFI